jgi:protein-tyrosine phosphatase
MVCLGNICRSPMAEGILRQKILLHRLPWEVDSAGTGGWHVGETPDERAIKTMRKMGVDISGFIARQFQVSDFSRFDHIYVMDSSNYLEVIRQASGDQEINKVDLIMNELYEGRNMAVPDPYYGGMTDFMNVYDMLNKACDRIVEKYKHGNIR